MKRTTQNGTIALLILCTVLFGLHMFVNNVAADPVGASVTSNTTDTGPTITPGNLTDAGGTINLVVFDALQQNTNWKAYVGNVTGTLTLDDANSNTIYDWSITGAISGEVYASRASNVNFGTIGCSGATPISNEQTVLGMAMSDPDSINSTFNETTHAGFSVGTTPITASNCQSTATYLNDTRQTLTVGTNFQEVLLADGSNNLVYTALIADNQLGFDNASILDFQMLVPEDGDNATPKTYYFWVELS